MKQLRRPAVRAVAASIAAALLVTGCSSSSDDEAPEGGGNSEEPQALREGMRGESAGGDPVEGGSLTYAAFAEPRSLDPAVTIAAATTGGVEMANIYDVLLNYDSEKQDFVPRLAEGLEADDEFDTWTLKLRDGVTFSNGEPLDAAAVKWSQERYASMPAPEAALWNGNVVSIKTPDESTVVYELNKSWPGFPSILSTGPGMVVAQESVGGSEEDFTPIGAGPFTLGEWSPTEAMELAANEDYWDGKPHLDSVRVVYLNDQQTAMDSLQSGSVDVALIRDPEKVDALVEDDAPGYVSMTSAANAAIINAAEGRPGADPRVRKAMALAIDPDLIRERAFDGFGFAGSTIFGDYSQWSSDAEGLPHDPEQAKALLEEAKADGFDGKVEYIDASDPSSRATALAVKASLESVGFEVDVNLMRTIADQIAKIVVDRDYDLAAWGLAYREPDPFSKMFATMHSDGTQTYNMYTSPEMDALIEKLQAAADQDEKVAVLAEIQEQVNQDVPYLSWSPYSEFSVWNDNVGGVVGGSTSMLLFDQAWVA